MLRSIGLILCLVAGTYQLSISKFEVPSSVPAGENVTLECQYQLKPGDVETSQFLVKWWWMPHEQGNSRKQIYQRIARYAPAVTNNRIKIQDNDAIVLISVTPKDSGVYECEVSDIDEVRRHQELVVFTPGSGPHLNVSVIADGDDDDDKPDALVTCEADDVAPLPHLVIKVNNEDVNLEETLSRDKDGVFDITARAKLSMSDIEDAHIHCELFYKNENVSHIPFTDEILEYNAEGSDSTTTELPEEEVPEDIEATTLELLPDAACTPSMSFVLLIAIVTPLQLMFLFY